LKTNIEAQVIGWPVSQKSVIVVQEFSNVKKKLTLNNGKKQKSELYRLNISSATFRKTVPEVQGLMIKAYRLFKINRFEEADSLYNQILKKGETSLIKRFKKINGVEIKISWTKGNYFGKEEPTFDCELIITNSESRQLAFNALVDFAIEFDQQTIHISRVLEIIPKGMKVGIENKDGSVYEPNIEIEFDHKISKKEFKKISSEIQSIGQKGEKLAGSTLSPDNKCLILYNISKFKKYEQFYKEIEQLIKRLDQMGNPPRGVKSNIRQLWNYGRTEDEGGSTWTFKQLKEGNIPSIISNEERE